MILAFAIEPTVSNVSMEIINNNNKLLIYFLNEGITGALLGLVTKSLFQILKLAGSWIDLHIGFSMLSLADASASSTTTVTGKLLEYCTLVLFFITDAHHLIIKSLIESFSVCFCRFINNFIRIYDGKYADNNRISLYGNKNCITYSYYNYNDRYMYGISI